MTMSNLGEQFEVIPEIEALARKLHAQTLPEKKNKQRQQRFERDLEITSEAESNFEPDLMGDENQTIRQLNAAPDGQQPMCITFPNGETSYVLKTGLIHLLPTFHGLPTENPHKHLKEFHMVCLSTKPQGVSDDQIKLRAFSFSLADIAKDWLFDLPPNSVTTWTDMAKLFLDRFFPVTKASEIRRIIMSIQ
ncbi:hypothetical protein HRI_005193900 [Hibiscus trionum]|uniref:Retrotransposon gag domain-containing protein n=1 Tax=Hibiscus trionum TaxID=183268 RepID=A0A9W7JH56_HIBTR|nr:hypothetical protein HRI_005193900 [Hibiscus trionum]